MPSALVGRNGDDLEAVVSMLLCCKFERAARRRPGQGDLGIDVAVPLDDGRLDVYQVKRYDRALDSGQWNKIKKSYETLLKAMSDGKVAVRSWFLVMPLDQSSSDIKKFEQLVDGSPFEVCEWRGSTWLDTLASQNPKVIDYYLGNGKARLEEAHRDLITVLGGREHAEIDADVAATSEGLGALHRSLNMHDPLFQYDFAVSDGGRPLEIPANPPERLAFIDHRSNRDVSVTWTVFATCDEAFRERPSPIDVQFDVGQHPELRESLRLFQEYGKPFQSPEGAANFNADLPGGLGGPSEAPLSGLARHPPMPSAHTFCGSAPFTTTSDLLRWHVST